MGGELEATTRELNTGFCLVYDLLDLLYPYLLLLSLSQPLLELHQSLVPVGNPVLGEKWSVPGSTPS